MVKSTGVQEDTKQSKGRLITFDDLVGENADNFKGALIEHSLIRMLGKSIDQKQYEQIRASIREERDSKPYELWTLEVEEGHPNCMYTQMEFPEIPTETGYVKFVCFGKSPRDHLKTVNEREVSKYLVENAQNLGGQVNPECFWSNDRFVAFQLLEKQEDISLESELKRLDQPGKIGKLEQAVEVISRINSLPVGRIEEILKKRTYEGCYGSWKIPEFEEEKFGERVVKPLSEYPKKGIVNSDLHPGNLYLKKDGSIWVIDWERAMLGAAQSDLARLMIYTGFGRQSAREQEGHFVDRLYDNMVINDCKNGSTSPYPLSRRDFHHHYLLAKAFEYGKIANIERNHIARQRASLSDPAYLVQVDKNLAEKALSAKEKNRDNAIILGVRTLKDAYKE